jgi:hypothetical protein
MVFLLQHAHLSAVPLATQEHYNFYSCVGNDPWPQPSLAQAMTNPNILAFYAAGNPEHLSEPFKWLILCSSLDGHYLWWC